jgi:hypothetical protein
MYGLQYEAAHARSTDGYPSIDNRHAREPDGVYAS